MEIIHPYMLELPSEELFRDCDQCIRATSTVMHANLLLFKTVIAGDGWGQIAVPIIEAYPETAIIFIGSLLTLVFGVLNLIVADFWPNSPQTFCVYVDCQTLALIPSWSLQAGGCRHIR